VGDLRPAPVNAKNDELPDAARPILKECNRLLTAVIPDLGGSRRGFGIKFLRPYSLMSQQKQRDQCLQDARDRQNNIVFPQTLANETRLWRNIATRPATALTWAGLAVLGLFAFGFIAILLVIFIRAGEWVEVLAGALFTLLIFGPIIGLIVWATRRNLRNLEDSRHESKKAKH
jgi:hypothetical protein